MKFNGLLNKLSESIAISRNKLLNPMKKVSSHGGGGNLKSSPNNMHLSLKWSIVNRKD